MTKIADAIQLFNCPGPKPNGLQATEKGLWVIDQGNNYAYLLDWESGSTIKSFFINISAALRVSIGSGNKYFLSGITSNLTKLFSS